MEMQRLDFFGGWGRGDLSSPFKQADREVSQCNSWMVCSTLFEQLVTYQVCLPLGMPNYRIAYVRVLEGFKNQLCLHTNNFSNTLTLVSTIQIMKHYKVKLEKNETTYY